MVMANKSLFFSFVVICQQTSCVCVPLANDVSNCVTWLQDVTRALNRNPKLNLPPEAPYSVIQPFIREACKLAWNMSALAYPLDIALATDAELFDENKYAHFPFVLQS